MPSFTPTHTAASTGMDAWARPDPGAAPVSRLEPWLDVELVRTWQGWAEVRCSNGWECWVDAAQLRPIAAASSPPPPAPPAASPRWTPPPAPAPRYAPPATAAPTYAQAPPASPRYDVPPSTPATYGGRQPGPHAYPPGPPAQPAYAQPAYAQPAYAQPAYAQPAYAQPAYAPQAYAPARPAPAPRDPSRPYAAAFRAAYPQGLPPSGVVTRGSARGTSAGVRIGATAAGAATVVVGAFLPWLRGDGSLGFGSPDIPAQALLGISSEGSGPVSVAVLLVAAAVVAVVAATRPGLSIVRRLAGWAAVVIPTLFVAQLQRSLSEFAAGSPDAPTVLSSTGIGVVVTLLGGLVIALAPSGKARP